MKKRVVFQRSLIVLAVSVGIYWGKFLLRQSIDGWEEEALDSLGLVMVLLGFCARIVARGYKESGSMGGGKLVTGGLYAYIRNPMYFGTFFIGMGVVMTVFHAVAIAVFLTGYLAIYIPQIMREEKILLQHFGGEYREYCRTVPRLIPAWRSWGAFLGELFPRDGKAIWRESLSVGLVLLGMVVIQTVIEARAKGITEALEEPLEFALAIIVFFLLLSFFVKEEK